MAKKYHVLDTNVYLTDPNALWKYGKNDIVLPFKVLEEIDKQKKRSDLVGYNARVIVKTLEEYRKKGSLRKGVRIGKNKGFISTKGFDPQFLPKGYDVKIADNEILAVALTLKNELPDNKVVVISRDINMRLKCDALGIETADYEFEKIVSKREELYSGFSSVSVDDQVIDRFYSGEDVFLEEKLHPNQFVMMISNSDNKKTALARFSNEGEPLRKLTNFKKGVWDVRPRNKEQTFALELLFDPEVPLVSLIGMSGTGKTLMAVAAALEQTVPGRMERYKRMIVSRPIQPMGKDIGYLPGSLNEKMAPWLAPIQDNLRYLLGDDNIQLEEYERNGIIEIEALTYIRGRSISNAFMIIDEAQNLTMHEIKTILTRIGENTKIVLTGDIAQIDNTFVNEFTNGLTNTVEKFKSQEISGHVTMNKGERSNLATIAAKIL